MSNECSICYGDLTEDPCMVDCAAGHIFHHQCITNSVLNTKKECPLDRQNISKIIHKGDIKKLPEPIPKIEIEHPNVEYEDTPCFICECNTRGDLDYDEVVVCSNCENVYVHAECEERVTGRRFNYGVYWYCPPCRANRLSNPRRRR